MLAIGCLGVEKESRALNEPARKEKGATHGELGMPVNLEAAQCELDAVTHEKREEELG